MVVTSSITHTLTIPKVPWIAQVHAGHVTTIKAPVRKRHIHFFVKLKLLADDLKILAAINTCQDFTKDRFINLADGVGDYAPLLCRRSKLTGDSIAPVKALY